MGLLKSFIDSCFSVGKFQDDGILLIPDNLKIPWSLISDFEVFGLSSYGIRFLGGVGISISYSNFNDQWSPELSIEDAKTIFAKATVERICYDFPDYDAFAKLSLEEKFEKIRLAHSEVTAGLSLIDQIPQTLQNDEVAVNCDGQWAYIIAIAWHICVVLDELNGIGKPIPEWLIEIRDGILKKNMLTHLTDHIIPELNLHKSALENDKEKLAEAQNYAIYIWKLGFAEGREYDYLRACALFGYDDPVVLTRVGDYLVKTCDVRRKLIVCSNGLPSAVFFRKENREMLVTSEEDLREYNRLANQKDKIVFQPGHPQNGCTYVQHPLCPNVYYEVNSFHDSVLERKQNELLRVFESLGAYSAKVEVFHERQETANEETELQVEGNGTNGVISGSGATHNRREKAKDALMSQHATKDWQFNPPEKPILPSDLLFYPTEETWQQLAKSVLRGGLKHAVVDLEYKTEYGVTEKYLREISASAKTLIPSYEMNLKQNFSSSLHRLTTTRWHYEVVFEDEKGKRAGKKHGTEAKDKKVDGQYKVEQLFLKRAKRYANSEERIDSEQKADLESFARKYGIDDLRMEELIEEAFE